MKIFDMHVHVFPDSVAKKAVDNLRDYYNINMASSGTWSDFENSIKEAQIIEGCLIHSTATLPRQAKKVNDFVAGLIGGNIYGFGSVHPDCEDITEEIDRMISLGLSGIKLHCDFQGFNADCEKAFRIYEYAQGKLPILFHAGDENVNSSSPVRLRRVHDMFPRLTMIAAHLGGYRMWDDAEKYLIGQDVYIDTSSSIQFMDKERAVRIIRAHGTERCLFGSDYPMHNQAQCIKTFLELGMTESENNAILWDNAIKLLKKGAL